MVVDPPRDGEGFDRRLDHRVHADLRLQPSTSDAGTSERNGEAAPSELGARHPRTLPAALACECSHVRLLTTRQLPAIAQEWRTTWQISSAHTAR